MVLGQVVAPFVISMMPSLFALLPNSAKVMAMSAEICVKFIIRVSSHVSVLGAIVSAVFCLLQAFTLTENIQSHFISRFYFKVSNH